MQAFLKLIRYKNLIILALLQLIVALSFSSNDIFLIASLIVITSFVTAAGYTINNYFDVETDRVNEKKDRVVGLVISKKQTFILYISFTSLAVIGSWMIHLNLSYAVICISILLLLYSLVLKKIAIVGNVLVAFLSALSMLFVLYPSFDKIQSLVFYLTAVFYISWIRELAKDIEDIEGDTRINAKTFPVLFGIEWSKKVLYVLLLCYQWHLFFYIQNKQLFIIYFTLILVLNIYLFLRIWRAKIKADFKSLSDFIKAYFILGICLIAIELFF